MKKLISLMLALLMLCAPLVLASCNMGGGSSSNVYATMAASIADAGYSFEMEIMRDDAQMQSILTYYDLEDVVTLAEIDWWDYSSDNEVAVIEFESSSAAKNGMSNIDERWADVHVVEQYKNCLLIAENESALAPLTSGKGATSATLAKIFTNIVETGECNIEYEYGYDVASEWVEEMGGPLPIAVFEADFVMDGKEETIVVAQYENKDDARAGFEAINLASDRDFDAMSVNNDCVLASDHGNAIDFILNGK